MDFFADGGFQQLFCDLNEQYPVVSTMWSDSEDGVSCSQDYYEINKVPDYNSRYCDNDCYLFTVEPEPDPNLNEKQLQVSLDYLLGSNCDLLDGNSESPCLQTNTNALTLQAKELTDWEEKFLDNYIEIPELIDFLPEKTPLCTENCNHFLQESAEKLKLFATPPSSPAFSTSSSSSGSSENPTEITSRTKSSPPEHTKENEKIYTCNFADCGKIYAKPAHLKAHLRRHLGEKPYVCTWSDCTWRFSRSDELARHRRSHSGIKPYRCDFCVKCFARSDHLTKHRKVHERRILAASKAGKISLDGVMPQSVLTVRPGRKRKNQL
ncbi:Kruppel-like factor 15 [Musca autumnalis]|uniref:Kruppel-like factor 15 n=1 Tax=Musca autumnalis TaxID=221902 RepID=UPI003CE90074